ncbi:hypothetical protein A6769_18225 [Nostoc punctiforme NIES-2108]|uniref:Uncharacterized protein n=1 Tax=Nostoc punctiforme NIES-2108 TaxID=1356359 RepID=A0A367RIM9_NOSPU|nr:hypothetical protein A6769_18225 [Nostoc punctiforme NIES-2108]
MPQATAKDAFSARGSANAQRLEEKDAKRRKKCLTELYCFIVTNDKEQMTKDDHNKNFHNLI